MIRRPNKLLMLGAGALVVALHATVLFAVIPAVSQRMHTSYNQDEYADGYDLLASNLADGGGYRMYPDTAETLMREPGYPLLLAGIFILFGKNFTVVKLTNMIMAFVVAWLILRLARQLSDRPVMILGPPLLFLFHPGTLVAESRGGVEVLFTLCLALFMTTLYWAMKQGEAWKYAVCGAVLGLTLLVRSTPVLFPAFLGAYFFLFDARGGREKLLVVRNMALMAAVMVAVLSPWIIRNYYLTGKFVPTASVLGVSAQTGQYMLTHQVSDDRRSDREAAQERNELAKELGYPFRGGYYQCFYSSVDEVKFSNFLVKRVVTEYAKSPGTFLRVVATNFVYFWIGGKNSNSIRLNVIIQVPLILLAAFGVAQAAKYHQMKIIAPMLLLIGYVIAISLPILAQARYSVPLVPYMSILGCMALAAAFQTAPGQARVSAREMIKRGSEMNSGVAR
jgi:4-amino-4-deoxy-L-arabinose transferase-like glycosyltransferase